MEHTLGNADIMSKSADFGVIQTWIQILTLPLLKTETSVTVGLRRMAGGSCRSGEDSGRNPGLREQPRGAQLPRRQAWMVSVPWGSAWLSCSLAPLQLFLL